MVGHLQHHQDDKSLWYNRRVQRLIFAISFFLLVAMGFYYWPTMTRIPIKSLAGLSNNSPGPSSPASTKGLLDPTRVALLMETRPLPFLPALLSHFISVLEPTWSFRFVGSPTAMALIASSRALSLHIKSGKLVLTEIPPNYPITSQEAISATLTNLEFYKDFLAPAEWLLVFQADSIICAASKHSVEDWVSENYTWLGAPWNLGVRGGNGGLSLRHVPPILKLLEKETRVAGSELEDRWLCDRLATMPGANMPGPEIERHFSVEGVWTERPFGYHLRGSGKTLVPEIWGNKTRRKEIFEYCPEVKIVLDVDLP